jgi:gas vesicle protein
VNELHGESHHRRLSPSALSFSAQACWLERRHDEAKEIIMQTYEERRGGNDFLFGLIAGGVIGAGLAMAFAPRLASDLRQRVKKSAADLTNAASQTYQDVGARITDVVDGVTAKGQAIRDDVADAVGRGAREVEQFAMASKTR